MKKDFHVFSHIPMLRSGFALGVTLLATSTAFATTHDLSALEDALVAQDGDVLTGKLGKELQISIAAGATVTLNGVDINGDEAWNTGAYAGISCLGNCNIILADGSENVVIGFNEFYPGIHIPENFTITIDGKGSLETYSNGYGAGIGGGQNISCGNIIINGGSITAEVKKSGGIGNNAAGIGGGYCAKCGNITISGGTVVARGGNAAPGIGLGFGELGVSCGKITINGGDVVATGGYRAPGIGLGAIGYGGASGEAIIIGDKAKVTVVRGTDASYSIGIGEITYAGAEGSVGSITIGGEETGYIVTSPFTYPSPLFYVSKGIDDGVRKAVINGDYKGEEAFSIPGMINVDKVVFNRTFSTSGYSTIMLPFCTSGGHLKNAESVIEFDGMTTNDKGELAVGMKYVWCSPEHEASLKAAAEAAGKDYYEQCYSNKELYTGNMDAYTPYMVQMKGVELGFGVATTLVPTPATAEVSSGDGWTFKAALQKKVFTKDDTKDGRIWGFAGEERNGATIGKFVRFGKGAYVQPFRAYLESSSPQLVSASPNAQFAASPTIGTETASIESIDVVIVSRGNDGEKHTTTIGKLNTRTGEFQMIRDYDLKGRKTSITNRAQGAYYGKKVLKK